MLATIRRIWHHPANAGRRIRATALYFCWQAWQRVVRKPWTVRLGTTLRIRLYPHSVVAAFVLYFRVPDFSEMSFIQAYLRPGDLFVDVGANVGVYSLWATRTHDVRVIAFEPSAIAHQRLRENVAMNDLQGRIVVLNQAVGAERGRAYLTVGLDAINRISDEMDGEREEVNVTCLDSTLSSDSDVVKDAVPSIVKIDVEGEEVNVLRGGMTSLAKYQPVLIVEVNDPDGLRRILSNLGYEAFGFDASTGQLSPVPYTRGSNIIAIADIDVARRRLSECRE